jgi:hypothetical protein
MIGTPTFWRRMVIAGLGGAGILKNRHVGSNQFLTRLPRAIGLTPSVAQ